MDATETTQQEMKAPEPTKENAWLQNLAGEWTYEIEASMGPDDAAMTSTGKESVRAIGKYWIVGDGTGQGPDGGEDTMIITLGFDPAKGSFVGTWIGSMMPNLWVYEGELDGNTLSLYSTGPSMTGEGTAEYKDVVEVEDDDHRTLMGHFKDENGQWQRMMTARYTRVR
jgi:hypothetical protein